MNPNVNDITTLSNVELSLSILNVTIKRCQYQPDTLIEILHIAQAQFGYLDQKVLLYITQQLQLPPSWVYGVATFYHLFSLIPKGKHHCVVCTGTACYVKGADALLAAIEQVKRCSLKPEDSAQSFSLATTRCLGTCGLAPIAVLDDVVYGKQTPEMVRDRVQSLLPNTLN